ncbi:indole-3-glycerol phosphate synthase TrpC [Brevibacillus laterosporus]|uniref:indole-3-glycerol phosphate synthase TrpC n=1 Tax=Brevibacillus laterosporus TaxID=1465 RepID=UPI00037766F0|nr:indole-3-glycerol phosphate synthase TrpC [Brevibacillus laterosporus]ATO51206.1 indole-3-glycerol phosphate synthase [Brevibacillus laterosporus DSM 25]MBG9804142.1 indole-3-glycerol phosphate synthase [Brevibacillus laterosporus]MED2004147.1 indole-3-glycerol phosphate synthase TrpC [Brevibacillus laterosporus]MED4763364.1 indole-3-glycerol phosphate synthase TrpC [Brevibacillus laterosporus]TPH14832.1 indole-3-glycerol phosphate synthase TrpC [Brevibacillus laterosporus]
MLRKIVEQKKVEVAALRQETTLQQMLTEIQALPGTRGFVKALTTSPRKVSLIAEVKKASPSKGIIRADFDPAAIAKSYQEAGVDAISVLTDETFFQGDLKYLHIIRELVLQPLLRKDFTIDEYQIVQARASGADAILLIAAILDREQIKHFYQMAVEVGLDVLIEIHDHAELEQVLSVVDPMLLGINNRDLRSFTTNLNTSVELLKLIPTKIPVVSESGLATAADVKAVGTAGARSILVGEQFMRQLDVVSAVRDLMQDQQMKPQMISRGETI